jgi:predicted DNA-binding transcriptional regulator YafY
MRLAKRQSRWIRSCKPSRRAIACISAIARTGDRSERDVDPYQVVYRAGRWYLVAYCHLRADLRVFRLDHIQHARTLDETFTPQTVDAVAAVERAIAQAPRRWEFAVLADATVETLRSRMPATTATLHPQADGTTLLRGYADDLDILACTLAGLRCPLVILRPDELRDAFRALADRLRAIADHPATSTADERKEKVHEHR